MFKCIKNLVEQRRPQIAAVGGGCAGCVGGCAPSAVAAVFDTRFRRSQRKEERRGPH